LSSKGSFTEGKPTSLAITKSATSFTQQKKHSRQIKSLIDFGEQKTKGNQKISPEINSGLNI